MTGFWTLTMTLPNGFWNGVYCVSKFPISVLHKCCFYCLGERHTAHERPCACISEPNRTCPPWTSHGNPPDSSFYPELDPTRIPWDQKLLLQAKIDLPRTISTLSLVPSAGFLFTFSVEIWDITAQSSCREGGPGPFMEKQLSPQWRKWFAEKKDYKIRLLLSLLSLPPPD